jgi:hypothetical protein
VRVKELKLKNQQQLKHTKKCLEINKKIKYMRYLKTFESFREPLNREEMIETLSSTSTFEREELEAMTDDELEELFHSLETEDWISELDRESTSDENWIGGPYNPREEEEGDYYESYTFEDFTHADMEDVRELLEMGLTEDQIAIELDLEVYVVKQIIDTINKHGSVSDELEGLDESKKSGVTASLKKKSKASGIPVGILRKVFSKGMQAWNAGHRPGVAQHQWGMGRVNSFITGAGGARKADADLWTKAKAAKARKKKRKK